MNQIAFTIGTKAIHWYGVCIAIGFLTATLLMLWKRNYSRLSKDNIYDLAMIAVITGIIGARICYVVHEWDSDFDGRPFSEVFRIDKGGLEFYGGFILAFISVCIYARIKKLSILNILDIAAPAVAIAHACGRVGCFLEGCCFGKPAPAGLPGTVCYPAHTLPWLVHHHQSVPVYPVQLYEAVLNVLLCHLLLFLMKKQLEPGMLAVIYMLSYAVMRFCLEFIRGDNPPLFFGLTFSQHFALWIMLPISLILLLIIYSQKGTQHE